MREQMLAPSGAGRRRALLASLCVAAVVGLFFAITAGAGQVGTAIGFEDDDGNLAPDSSTGAINFDWNSFDPTTWTGPTNQQVSSKTQDGWQFKGLTDWQASTSDSAFAGGTKQDDECARLITQKADNKADLKRVYLASKTGTNNHTYLMLAWVRIPQNTTSPSAHVAFEFNKGTTPCGGSSGNLVHRTAGDMLVLYDFEGGNTDVPTIRLSRWVTSGTCEIANNDPPCWNPAVTLAAGTAEAAVNTGATPVSDTIAPTDESLGTNEFGEAGIDLTNAGVFTAGTCETFGKAFGVSRTSGNSGTAQMKDIVGPTDFTLTNCGQIIIKKRTNPRGVNQNFGFTSNINTAASFSCTTDTTPATFTLNDNGNSGTNDSGGNTENCTNVSAGTYTVSEDTPVPNGFVFNNFTCTSSGTGTSTSPVSSTTQQNVSITLAGGGVVTCIYTNDQVQTTTATRQFVYPQDTARITATGGGDLAGSVKFQLFDSLSDCQDVTDVKFEQSFTVSGAPPVVKTTTNYPGGAGITTGPYAITADPSSTHYWKVTYDSTNAQTDSVSACNTETTTVTFAGNDTSISVP
jgi:hypothetical protein